MFVFRDLFTAVVLVASLFFREPALAFFAVPFFATDLGTAFVELFAVTLEDAAFFAVLFIPTVFLL